MEILVGADPEVFVRGPNGNVSGHGMVPGTKKTPHAVPGGAVQVDGTALEFNIDPAKNEKEFVARIKQLMLQLQGMLPEGHTLDPSATVKYEEMYFASLPKYAKRLGCSPDYDAYSGYEMCRGDAPETLRTAAGHLHIGWTKDQRPFSGQHFQSCRTLTRELDCQLGLASVLFDPDGQERRQLYGQAGAFRPKPYGVEYRVLSNSWLQDEKLMAWVYSMSVSCFKRLCERRFYFHRAVGGDTVQQVINEGDSERAQELLLSIGAAMPPGHEVEASEGPGTSTHFAPGMIYKTSGTDWPTWDGT